MTQQCYLLICVLALTACHQKSQTPDIPKADTITKVLPDTLKPESNDSIVMEKIIVSDSLISYNDSSFRDLTSDVKVISKKEFMSYKNKYKMGCTLDSGHFISGSGLYVSHSCNEICETYLEEKATNRRMLMPSDYDAGILGMQLSPGCNQLLVCSSYDGPDYDDYYAYRAEIMAFNVTGGKGLHGIKPAFKYYTKDWSIEDVTWASDKTIALKIYEGSGGGLRTTVQYKYVKLDVDK